MRINVKQYIDLKCKKCEKTFKKELKEYTRQSKKGKECNYCSLDCLYSSGLNKDKFSPFRYFLKSSRKNSKRKNMQFDLDLPFLKELWDKQNGICPYTGIKMDLGISTYNKARTIWSASLDRIDSDKGYTKDNVEWICIFVNLGKNDYSKEEVKEFFNKIKMVGAPVANL